MAVDNAKMKINEMLLNYQAVRAYVSKVQREEVYHLQKDGIINKEYFSPALLSSTFSAKVVNNFYNEFKKELVQSPVTIRFASDNPRNLANKATQKESKLLEKFNNKEIGEYSEIIQENGEPVLYYVLPTKATTDKCMKCHSDPSLAPKGLIDIYGDENGFYENPGDIRAVLSTTYPLGSDFKNANQTFLILTLVTLIIFTALVFLVYFFTRKINEANINLDKKVILRTKELKEEKEHMKAILDINPNIIIVIRDEKIISANKQFCKFFNCNTLDEFIEKYKTISSFIVQVDKKVLSNNKQIDGLLWYEYLVKIEKNTHNIEVDFNNTISFFLTSATYFSDHGDILVTLNDITEQMKKDKLLHEQTKLAAMGEMIGNIAHQWRQPLSVISTSSSGMQIQKEHNILDDEKFYNYCEIINENVEYLSKTIDDFRDFIKVDKEKVHFLLNNSLKSFLKLVDGSIKKDSINIVLDIDSTVELFGYQNELLQCLMNLFNNSKDALNNIEEENRYIFITIKKENNKIIISFKDSGGGIKKDIQSKIFEPYFTTKHQSQGTGLGLHMVYAMIVDSMGGTIESRNVEYLYDNKTLKGSEFLIKFPL
jgi:signal transduction histidine kinase